jgi:chemotaxis protein methyltransferase CheR
MAFSSESTAEHTALVLLRDLIAERIAVRFEDRQLDILMDKISPLIAERGGSILDYYYLLKYDELEQQEWKRVMDAVSVRETFFWRELDQVRTLVELIVPAWASRARGEPLRIWSAACASGEEPLSIAMALNEAGWFGRIPIEIYATDGSPQSVHMAQTGIYRDRSFRALPEEMKLKYFNKEDAGWRVDSGLHQHIRWATANLASESDVRRLASVPIIFCRNVFIYFSDQSIRQTVQMFYESMKTPGYLFVGVAESLLRVASQFELRQLGGAFVYVKEETPEKA